jgi:tetratricopeptide (TPR) repeat protein
MDAPEGNNEAAGQPKLSPEQQNVTTLLQQGRIPEACVALLDMIRAAESARGQYDGEAVQSRLLLARLQGLMGEPAHAEATLDAIRDIPEDNPAHAAVHLNARILLSLLRRQQGRYEEAFGLAGAVLDQLDATMPDPVNPDAFRTILQLVQIAREAGQYQQALDLCSKGIERFQGKVGEAHAHLILAAGQVLLAAEHYEQARDHFVSILDQVMEQAGEENELVIRARHGLAQLECELDNRSGAMEQLDKCVAVLQKGADPELVIEVEQTRLPLLQDGMEPRDAIQALSGFLNLVARVHGPRSIKTAEVLSSLGYQHRRQGDMPLAKSAYEQALSIWRSWRPEDDARVKTLTGIVAELG